MKGMAPRVAASMTTWGFTQMSKRVFRIWVEDTLNRNRMKGIHLHEVDGLARGLMSVLDYANATTRRPALWPAVVRTVLR